MPASRKRAWTKRTIRRSKVPAPRRCRFRKLHLRAIDDLRGHKVGILQAVPAGKIDNQLLLDTALAQYDVPSASVGRVPLTLAELSREVENKETDAVSAVGAPGSDGLPQRIAW